MARSSTRRRMLRTRRSGHLGPEGGDVPVNAPAKVMQPFGLRPECWRAVVLQLTSPRRWAIGGNYCVSGIDSNAREVQHGSISLKV
jgi:hypothetical protein